MSDVLALWGRWLPALLDGLEVSAAITAVCLVLGLPLGLALAFGTQSRTMSLRLPALALVETGRGAPALILLRLADVGPPLPAFAAACLALTWFTGAHTSGMIRSGLGAVPHGQAEAASVLGLTGRDALWFVVLPQGLRMALPALLGFAVLLFQTTSLCFAIALPELVSQAYRVGSTTSRALPILVLAGLLYAAICAPATLVVAALERRLDRRPGRHLA